MYEHIAIAVDGSEEAERAAKRGFDLARRFDASVEVVHVVEHRSLRLTKSSTERERLRERGESILAETAALAGDCPVSTTLLEGKPGVQISEHVQETDASLLVLGRQGATGLGKRLLGGVTEHVVQHGGVPVLVVPADAEPTGEYSRVLVPTDGSENAEAATPHGGAIASQYGAALHVLSVVDLQAAGGAFNAGGLEDEFVDRLEREGREAVDAVAEDVAASAPDVSVETAVNQTASLDGIAVGIREYVYTNDVDIVVMGSHGRSNLKRQLLGSVTSQLLRDIDVPVLVVNSRV
ncbi:universal stress protein [Haloarcula salina]|uniref:universal stress protein n=1 Tax=Haloarcula salina TaxID=1429914 RepID=UPI003C6ED47D